MGWRRTRQSVILKDVKPPLIVMPLPSSETRFMPSLCRRINPINSSVSGKSSFSHLRISYRDKVMKGFLTRGETFALKRVTYFIQNSITSDGNEPWFYLERGYFEKLKIHPGHEACNKEVDIFGVYFSINTKPARLHVLLRFRHGTWCSTAYTYHYRF